MGQGEAAPPNEVHEEEPEDATATHSHTLSCSRAIRERRAGRARVHVSTAARIRSFPTLHLDLQLAHCALLPAFGLTFGSLACISSTVPYARCWRRYPCLPSCCPLMKTAAQGRLKLLLMTDVGLCCDRASVEPKQN